MDPFGQVEVFEGRQQFIIYYCVGMAVGIVVLMIFVQIIRRRLNNDVEVVDKLSFTPSDFGIIGLCPEFSDDCDYSIQGITDEVKAYFKEKYGIDDLEYVNVSYDIENIFDLLDQERILLKKRELVNWYCEKKNWSEDEYNEQRGRFDEHDDFPCEREGLTGCF